jgi:hypothetical protein
MISLRAFSFDAPPKSYWHFESGDVYISGALSAGHVFPTESTGTFPYILTSMWAENSDTVVHLADRQIFFML